MILIIHRYGVEHWSALKLWGVLALTFIVGFFLGVILLSEFAYAIY